MDILYFNRRNQDKSSREINEQLREACNYFPSVKLFDPLPPHSFLNSSELFEVFRKKKESHFKSELETPPPPFIH